MGDQYNLFSFLKRLIYRVLVVPPSSATLERLSSELALVASCVLTTPCLSVCSLVYDCWHPKPLWYTDGGQGPACFIPARPHMRGGHRE